MKLAIFLFLLIVVIIFTFTIEKELKIFEIMFIWMTVWLITHSVSSILIENFNFFSVSNDSGDFIVHILKRLVLYPLIIVHFIDRMIRLKSKLSKNILIISNILIMSSLEFLFIYIGILINHSYNFGIALAEWTFTIILTIISWKWYQKNYILR
jgi:hypothetical protein